MTTGESYWYTISTTGTACLIPPLAVKDAMSVLTCNIRLRSVGVERPDVTSYRESQ